ncbi:TARDBP family protein [Megaselia abdita]
MDHFIKVSENEGDDSIIELPTESDNSLLLSTLQAQFPASTGLKYKRVENEISTYRGVRLNEGRLYPPSQDDGWGSVVYICVLPKETKRKMENIVENNISKARKIENQKTTDLIVLGLNYKSTEETLQKYFEEFGELMMYEIKKVKSTGQSRGFGFIRFASIEAQEKAIKARHFIDEKWCEVRLPKKDGNQGTPGKVYIGRCTEDLTTKDLSDYFSKFGDILDVYMPQQPFRGFAFITFLDSSVAQKLCGEDHVVKGVSVFVANATQKNGQQHNGPDNNSFQQNRDSGNFQNYQQHQQHHQQQQQQQQSDNRGRGGSSFNFAQPGFLEMPNLQNLGIGGGNRIGGGGGGARRQPWNSSNY